MNVRDFIHAWMDGRRAEIPVRDLLTVIAIQDYMLAGEGAAKIRERLHNELANYRERIDNEVTKRRLVIQTVTQKLKALGHALADAIVDGKEPKTIKVTMLSWRPRRRARKASWTRSSRPARRRAGSCLR